MRLHKISLAAMALGGGLLLTACGGGGGGSDLTLRGTAAIGDPVVGPVSATCKEGRGTSPSNSDGSFSVVINNGVGPCLLSMTIPNTTNMLYSVTSGSTATQTANLTPMTTLMVEYLRNLPNMPSTQNPQDWFASPVTKLFLSDPQTLTTRIQDGFIPSLNSLLPPNTAPFALNANFLRTTFIANPSVSSIDADLIKLITSKFVTDLGALIKTFVDDLIKAALKDIPVITPPIGATGASGASGASG